MAIGTLWSCSKAIRAAAGAKRAREKERRKERKKEGRKKGRKEQTKSKRSCCRREKRFRADMGNDRFHIRDRPGKQRSA